MGIIYDQQTKIKCFTLFGVYDKPARADILNIINSTGYSSCLKCLQVGSNDESINGGSRRVFPFDTKNPTGPKRDNVSYFEHVEEAEKYDRSVHGIKGRCILRHLKYYHPLENTCIDYMHSILLGVVKTFFKYWFDGDIRKPYSLKKYMQVIDTRLLKFRPPNYVRSVPRSIYCWNKWRVHEYLSFLLYYSLPVFYKIVPHNIYVNLTKLVIFIEKILYVSIEREALLYIQNIILDFSKELSSLYDKSIMLSGVHELLHLVECTIQFGHLNSINCFPFEEVNRKFLNFINGKDLIGKEFIKIFFIIQSLCTSTHNDNIDNQLQQFIEKII